MAPFLQDISPSITGIFFFLALYILFRAVQHAIMFHRRNLISRKKGCKAVPSYPHRDPIWGFDLFLENSRLFKTGGFLKRVQERFLSLNTWTFSVLNLGVRMINTAEPENIKAILATQFREFELPKGRKTVSILFLLSNLRRNIGLGHLVEKRLQLSLPFIPALFYPPSDEMTLTILLEFLAGVRAWHR